jgi:hypothetical protein
MLERDKAMRKARDKILRRVGEWLKAKGFTQAGVGHYTRLAIDQVCHIGFQKLSSGRTVRVMCHITSDAGEPHSIRGPWSDHFSGKRAPNGKGYFFGWNTRETDIARCADEYCRYIDEVVVVWFKKQVGKKWQA